MNNYFNIIPIFIFTLFYGQKNELFPYLFENNKYGFIDMNGKVVVQPNYHFVQDFSDGRAFVNKDFKPNGDRKWLCIDTLGRVIYNLNDDWPEEKYKDGYAVLSGKRGNYFVDLNGKNIFNKYWASIRSNFKNGIALVSNERLKNYYYIDKSGDSLGKGVEYDFKMKNKEGLYIYREDGKYFIIDSTFQVIGKGFEEIEGFNEGLIKVKDSDLWGFINTKGEVIVPIIYGQERDRNWDDVLELNTDSLDAIMLPTFRNLSLFYEGLASFQKDSLIGFLNKDGEVQIKPKFKKVTFFSEGLAGASIDGIMWGFINTQGEFVIEPQYYEVSYFQDGVAGVIRNEYLAIWSEFPCDAIIDKENNIIYQDEMWNFIRFKGRIIEYYEGPHFRGKINYITPEGKKIEPN